MAWLGLGQIRESLVLHAPANGLLRSLRPSETNGDALPIPGSTMTVCVGDHRAVPIDKPAPIIRESGPKA